MLVTEHESGHGKLVLLVVSEPQYYEFSYFIQCLIRKRQQSLETVKKERPDLILLDISMPGYNGWEVLQQLREDQHSMPVVMVSADASEGCDRADSLQLNDGYIIKPIRLDLMLDTIAQMLALDWRFEKSAEPLAEIPSPETGTLALPDKAHRQQLANLARIGHRKGLLEALYELKHSGEAEGPFTRELTTLTNDFQFEKILELLKVAEHETS